MSEEPFQPRWELLTAEEVLPLSAPEPATALEPLEAALPTVALAPCWRCAKDVPCDAATCRYCRAPLMDSAPVTARGGSATLPEGDSLVAVLCCFGAMLLVMLVFHWVHSIGNIRDGKPTRGQLRDDLIFILVLEAVDSGLLVLAWLWAGKARRSVAAPTGDPVFMWGVAAPLLVLMLAANFAYHWVLRTILHQPLMPDPMMAQFGFSPLILLAFCIQPAVVEELFFRGLALGRLRDVTGWHGAVLISAVMFGIAHIGAPLSIPYLMGVGVVLGYVRVASGSLVLPILLHFGHNLAVLYLDTLQI